MTTEPKGKPPESREDGGEIRRLLRRMEADWAVVVPEAIHWDRRRSWCDEAAVKRWLISEYGAERGLAAWRWLERVPQGLMGQAWIWWRLVEAEHGERMLDGEAWWRNQYQVVIGGLGRRGPSGVDLLGLINGLPVVAVVWGTRASYLGRLWREIERTSRRQSRRWTSIQVVILVAERRVWIGAPGQRPWRAVGRAALEVADPVDWIGRVLQPARLVEWLTRGMRWQSDWRTGRLVKLIVWPDESAEWPAWFRAEGGLIRQRERQRGWTAAEAKRRQAKVERRMERWLAKQPNLTVAELAWWGWRITKMAPQMRPWFRRCAERVKARWRARQQRREERDEDDGEGRDGARRPRVEVDEPWRPVGHRAELGGPMDAPDAAGLGNRHCGHHPGGVAVVAAVACAGDEAATGGPVDRFTGDRPIAALREPAELSGGENQR